MNTQLLRAEFDARHIAQLDARAVGVGAQHDVAELLDRSELAIDDDRGPPGMIGSKKPGQVRRTDACHRASFPLCLGGYDFCHAAHEASKCKLSSDERPSAPAHFNCRFGIQE